MQLHRDSSEGINIIRSLDGTRVQLTDQLIEMPCIVTTQTILSPWQARQFSELALEDLTPAIATSPELIILGTGSMSRIPAVSLIHAVNSAGIGFEFMENAAACRTYNVLAHEGRVVALALLADERQSRIDS